MTHVGIRRLLKSVMVANVGLLYDAHSPHPFFPKDYTFPHQALLHPLFSLTDNA